MAQTPFSILLRRLSSENLSRYPHHKLTLLFSHGRSIRLLSTSQPNSSPDPKPSTLSARMSFVFDQIDAIEREQSDKDQTLQRIRAWRQAKRASNQNVGPQSGAYSSEVSVSSELSPAEPKMVESHPKLIPNPDESVEGNNRSRVELVHPWPEWIELIERLVQQKYFDLLKNDEDKTLQESGADHDHGHDPKAVEDDEFDFTKDFNMVQTACVNFGKDRFDILRSLSRQDIHILVGYGCPSANKKVAFSGKLLRKYIHLDEGDVCSSCSLRSSCVRAFLIPKKEDEARTIDVMRILLEFAFDPDPENGSVENKPLTKQKSVKTVVRKFLHQIVKLSAVPIDPNLPPPVVRRPPPKVKPPPTPPRKRIGRDDVEMKKGDWICSKCEFLNFAKNTVCLQCDAQRPKRQLLPGEWECPECNFLNYRRNVVCFHCECKRPPDAYTEGNMQEKQFGARTNFEKLAGRPEVSNAWNFDFDDDESDGADVAAFEYPDSAMRTNSPSDRQRNYKEFENSHQNISQVAKDHESSRPGMGFDDFDDFDDVNNYELETPDNPTRRVSANDLSEDDEHSESEDIKGSDYNMLVHTSTSSQSYAKPLSQKSAMYGSEDVCIDFYSNAKPSVHSNLKSNSFADRGRSRSPVGPSRGLTFGSDEESGLGSDVDKDLSGNFNSRQIKASKFAGDEDSLFSGPESDGIERLRGRKGNFTRDSGTRSSSFSKDLNRSPRASYNYRELESDDDDLSLSRGRSSGRGNFKGGNNHRGKPSNLCSRDFDRLPRKYPSYKDSRSDGDDDGLPSHRNRSQQDHVEYSRRGNFKGSSNHNLARNSGFRSNGSAEDFDGSSPGSRGSNRRSQRKGNDELKMNGGKFDLQKSRRGRGGFGKRQSGRSNDDDTHKDFGEVRNSRRIIER